jgi:hypothetical protein
MGCTHCGSLTNWWRWMTALANGFADFLLTAAVARSRLIASV